MKPLKPVRNLVVIGFLIGFIAIVAGFLAMNYIASQTIIPSQISK